MKKFLAMAVMAMFLVPASTHAALVLNGDFETGNLTDWVINAPTVSPTPSGLVEAKQTWLGVNPHGGSWMAVLAPGESAGTGGTGSPMLSQTGLAPDPFVISFWYNLYAYNLGEGSSGDIFRLWVEGLSGDDIIFAHPLADLPGGGPTTLGWTLFSTLVDLDTSKVITLNFRVRNDGNTSQNFTAFLDDVSVAPVPEPGTMMLLGSGLVGLAGWGRKKFRK